MRAIAAPLAERDFRRILIIKLSALGDVVHTIALLAALRRRYPGAEIDWLAKPSVAALVRHHPAVSRVIEYGEGHTEAPRYNWDGVKHFVRQLRDPRFLGMLRGLRRARYDLVVDVHGQMRTAFVTLMTRAPVRIGFDRPRRDVHEPAGRLLPEGTIGRSWKGAREGAWIAYTHPIRLATLDQHAVDRYLLAARMLGCPQDAPDQRFPIPPEAAARVDGLLADGGVAAGRRPILLAPAALWETKRWTADGFTAVARHFLAKGHPVVIVGAPNERAECAAIAAAAPGAIDLAGKTSLLELGALMSRAALCLTNDSGPMHMAVALGAPVVAVFGPTNERWIGPYGAPEAVIRSRPPCAPCYLRTLARCTHGHACMRDVTAARVIERMEARLAQESSPASSI